MGVLIAKEELISYLCELHIVWKLIVWVGWVLFSIGYVLFCDTPSYWSAVALPYEVLSMAAWFLFAYSLRNFNILIDIGKKTYIIYFLHMQLGIGFFNYSARELNIIQHELLILIIKPIVIVLLIYMGVKIVESVAGKTRLDNFLWIFGLK